MGSSMTCLCSCAPSSHLHPPRFLFLTKSSNLQEQSTTSSDTTSARNSIFHIPAIRVAKEKVKHPSTFKTHENVELIYSKSKKEDKRLKDLKVAKFLGLNQNRKSLLVMKEPKSKEREYKLFCLKVFKKEVSTSFEVIKAVISGHTSPFLASIKTVHEGDSQVYFLNEYVSGGVLFDVMHKSSIKNEMLIAFIMGEVLLALECLHQGVGIPCGNLKCSNVHLTSRGHIQLTDFGICREFSKNMPVEEFLYFAPEILEGANHDFVSDFWSFGIFLVLVLKGRIPFENWKEKAVLEKSIREGKVVLPEGLGPVAIDLISRLLRKNREERIGFNGLEEVKRHAFFAQVNWGMLRQMKLRSPFVMKGKTVSKEGSKENLSVSGNGEEGLIHSVLHFMK